MGCWQNYPDYSEHLDRVSELAHARYQAILCCFAFTRVILLTKVTPEAKNMDLQ